CCRPRRCCRCASCSATRKPSSSSTGSTRRRCARATLSRSTRARSARDSCASGSSSSTGSRAAWDSRFAVRTRTPKRGQTTGAPSMPAPRTFNIQSVKGRKVIDSLGNDVGTIEDIVIEPGTWKVSGFLVSLRRDLADKLHVERRGMLANPRIEIGSERVHTVGDNVILNIATEDIADALRERAPPAPAAEPFTPALDPALSPGDSTMPPLYEPPRY